MHTETFTSASANKYLRALSDQKEHLLALERETSTYCLSIDEEGDPPKYDYSKQSERLDAIDSESRRIRHALHVHNAHTLLPQSGITIDEALIVMAQLSHKKSRLATLRGNLPKERLGDRLFGSRNLVEYKYANYNVSYAEKDYEEVLQEISSLQLELDLVNQTQTFEVELED